MWVCFSDAFVSVVADRTIPANVLVRARRKGDVERFLGPENTGLGRFFVRETPDADYRYRASVPAEVVAEVMGSKVMGIEYANFKDSVKDDDLHEAYVGFWGIMYRMQVRAHRVIKPAVNYARGAFKNKKKAVVPLT